MKRAATIGSALILCFGAFAAGQHSVKPTVVDQTYTGKQIAAFEKSRHNSAYGNKLTILPCIEEDSVNCIWDADSVGNGEGDAFINYRGQYFYIENN